MQAADGLPPGIDSGMLTFSQAQGYEDLPGPLKLEELPEAARTRVWNAFYVSITANTKADFVGRTLVGDVWAVILNAKHAFHDKRPLDKWNRRLNYNQRQLRSSIETLPFNEVFDMIQFVIRHPECPQRFVDGMKEVFAQERLAYAIDDGPPPTIIPAVTSEEGNTIVGAMATLREAGLDGSEKHLRNAAYCINRQDWAGSVRESIHAVESVARQLDPKASQTLAPALKSLERSGTLHPALKEAFTKLYGYSSNEQGIRHALLDQDRANVGMDEAVFMLGACASFSSYLWRKHVAGS